MNPDLLQASDSSDEDYVPHIKFEDTSSDLDSDGSMQQKTSPNKESCSKSKKRRKNTSKCNKKLKNIDQSKPTDFQSEVLTENDKKQKEDDVWANFMKDTGFKSKSECVGNQSTKLLSSSNKDEYKNTTEENKSKKGSAIEVFNFAGENVVVNKQEKRRSEPENVNQGSTSKNTNTQANESKTHSSGIGGILNQLGKRTKINTLEKSKLDWDQFKREENLEEELQTFNRGKDGYLEKQDFLNRADLRRFEIERELRTIERSKRGNNLL